jgi:release factor glutamine methyltransferase
MARTLTPYERTHLARYGVSEQAVTDQHIPVEYVTRAVTFGGLELTVTPDVLIPRVETEELVELVVAHVQAKATHLSSVPVIADVGTGSGAIGLSIWHHLNQQRIAHQLWLSDLSPAAVKVATDNYHQLQNRYSVSKQETLPSASTAPVTILESNLLAAFPEGWRAHIIVANLPYIPHSRLAHLPVSVVQHEPLLALDGGADGLRLIKQLLEQARTRLHPDGTVFLEIDDTHTQRALEQLETGWEVTVLSDQAGRNRFAIARLKQ